MLRMDQYELVRTAHRIYGKNISELSRMTGHSRNTIKKAIREEPWGYKEREHQPFPVLEPYLETIDTWIEGEKDQPKKQRHTARRVYHRLIKERGQANNVFIRHNLNLDKQNALAYHQTIRYICFCCIKWRGKWHL